MRIKPADYPPVQLVEAHPDPGATEVVSPSSDDRVDRCDQITQTQRYTPLCQVPDLIFESVHRLLCRNGIEILSVQLGFNPIAGQLELRFSALDFESQKLEPVRNVHDPGFLPVKRHTELRMVGGFFSDSVFIVISHWRRDELPNKRDRVQTAAAKETWRQVIEGSAQKWSALFPTPPYHPDGLKKGLR